VQDQLLLQLQQLAAAAVPRQLLLLGRWQGHAAEVVSPGAAAAATGAPAAESSAVLLPQGMAIIGQGRGGLWQLLLLGLVVVTASPGRQRIWRCCWTGA